MANSTVKVFDGATLLGTATANASGAWSYHDRRAGRTALHSFTATATDAAGNTSAASAALNVTIDTTAPVAPTIASFSTDSGVAGDRITNDNTLTLTGTAEANSNGQDLRRRDAAGQRRGQRQRRWTYTTAALANGAHSLTATATDAAGNTGVARRALSVTIDTDGAQCSCHRERRDCQYESSDADRHRRSQQQSDRIRWRNAARHGNRGRRWCMELYDQPTFGRAPRFYCDGVRCGGQYKSGFSNL